MKRLMKSMLGVTLLEIMLVLAIAAMVIVMSVRYYQSAQASSQSNAFTNQVQAVTSSAENLAQGSGFGALTQATVQNILPGGATAWNLPWGGTMTYTATATGYTLTVGTVPSTGVCALITAKFTGMTKYTVSATCSSVTYNSSL